MTDKTPDEKPVEAVPKSEKPKATRTSKSRQAQQTPLEQAVHAYVNGFDKRKFADRLLNELAVVGIESLEDVGPHQFGDVRLALRATLRADAHAFFAAAAEIRSKS